jgi:hypothetical protein
MNRGIARRMREKGEFWVFFGLFWAGKWLFWSLKTDVFEGRSVWLGFCEAV